MKWIEKEATIENLENLILFVLDSLHLDVKPSKKLNMEMRLLCEEIFINIINHSYPTTKGTIRVGYEYDVQLKNITLNVQDFGVEFDPTKAEDPDVTMDIMEREIGGLGIFMYKKLSDSVTYIRKNDTNTLVIKKNIELEEKL